MLVALVDRVRQRPPPRPSPISATAWPSPRWKGPWRSIVTLGSIVIRNPRAPGKTPARTCLTPSDLIFAARANAGYHYLRTLQAILLHQLIKCGGILRRDTHAAMRDGVAKILYVEAAVDGMTVFHKENRMGHGGVFPLFAIPNFVHRGGSIGSRWS
jgi:hypothetical protein